MSNEIQAKNITNNLKKLARDGKMGFSLNQLRVIVALERLVARLESNPILSKHLVFKGGFALLKHIDSARFTHDIDASYFLYPLEKLIPMVIHAIDTDIQDGMWYGDIKHEKILLERTYDGIRINCAFQIGDPPENELKVKKLSRVHFDIALSDIKSPQYEKTQMPSLIANSNPVSWYVYPLEQIFSEKLETFVRRGDRNSRGKDIYDMVRIYPALLDSNKLVETIRKTFVDRNTAKPPSFHSFAQSLGLATLRISWASLIMPDPGLPFDEAWTKFLEIFIDLDPRL